MTCNVTNQTGGTITNGSAYHQWQGNVNGGSFGTLENNASYSFTINVGSGGHDLWTVKFTDANGNCYYRDNKQCDVESSDLDSGGPVNVNLLSGPQGFSIEMPSSSSCNDNYYDKCS